MLNCMISYFELTIILFQLKVAKEKHPSSTMYLETSPVIW